MKPCRRPNCTNPAASPSADFCGPDCHKAHRDQLEADRLETWFLGGAGRTKRLPNTGTCLRHGRRGCLLCVGENR